MAGRATPFKEALDWLKLTYTVYQTGAYVVAVSMFLIHSMVLKGDLLLYMTWRHLQKIDPGSYALPVPPHHSTSITGPPGPYYSDYSPIVRTSEFSDMDPGKEEGEGEFTTLT